MDKFTMGVYLMIVLLAVLYMRFGKSRQQRGHSKRNSDPHTESNTTATSSIGEESRPKDNVTDEHPLTTRAETHLAENSILGAIVHPSPIEVEKQMDIARPLLQPIENSTSLFEADKVDDLSRPWGQQLAGESTNLFELDRKHDLTKPFTSVEEK